MPTGKIRDDIWAVEGRTIFYMDKDKIVTWENSNEAFMEHWYLSYAAQTDEGRAPNFYEIGAHYQSTVRVFLAEFYTR
jgi:hypothetical protein